jgi:putative Holliday junction resolvase
VAVGNTFLRQAEPLNIIHAPTNDGKFAEVAALIGNWQPVLCVVGLPLHPDGESCEMTQRCRRFANQLQGRFKLPTILVDERYSSAVLNGKRGAHIDDDAAALILQQYFDENP